LLLSKSLVSAVQPVQTVHPRVHQNMSGVHHYHTHIDPLMRVAIEKEITRRFELYEGSNWKGDYSSVWIVG